MVGECDFCLKRALPGSVPDWGGCSEGGQNPLMAVVKTLDERLLDDSSCGEC